MSETSDATKRQNCRWCGMLHGPTCPSVKALEFHPDGSVKRVEFVTAGPVSLGGNLFIVPEARRSDFTTKAPKAQG